MSSKWQLAVNGVFRRRLQAGRIVQSGLCAYPVARGLSTGSHLLENKKVAIVGGGPVGLMTAVLLQHFYKDIILSVYERDPGPNAQVSGGTLDLHKETGQKAIEAGGILDQFFKLARPVEERMARKDASIIVHEPADENNLERPEIDRTDLRTLLLDNLKDDVVIWDKKFLALQVPVDQNGPFHLDFADGTTEVADVVIGANGGRSNVRHHVNNADRIYTGTCIIQGEVIDPKKSTPIFLSHSGTGNFMSMGEKKMFVSQFKNSGAINYYTSFRKPESWVHNNELDFSDKQTIIRFLNQQFHSWHPCFKELFDATDYFAYLPMYRVPVKTKWYRDHNVTLVGDAAHLMPPFAGVGVNTGFQDALTLSTALTSQKYNSIREALTAYEDSMVVYADKAQTDSSHAESLFHSAEKPEDIFAQRT